MKKWKVEGRIRADIHFAEIVSASTEESACEKASNNACEKHGITEGDYIDDEIYCEEIE